MIRMILGAIIIVGATIADSILTFHAAAARHLDFWQYASLNKTGIALLVWGYNPVAAATILGVVIVGGFLFMWGKVSD